ncbi:MAG: hypothetical protein V1698_01275 [bacterium]
MSKVILIIETEKELRNIWKEFFKLFFKLFPLDISIPVFVFGVEKELVTKIIQNFCVDIIFSEAINMSLVNKACCSAPYNPKPNVFYYGLDNLAKSNFIFSKKNDPLEIAQNIRTFLNRELEKTLFC